jgi:hypothetical protein
VALTADEEREYQQLSKQLAQMKAQQDGDRRLAEARAQRPAAAAAPTSSFSIWRAGLGAVREAAQGAMDTVDDLATAAGRATGIGGIAFGSHAKNGVVEYQGYDEFNKRGGDAVFGAKPAGGAKPSERTNYQLPKPNGYDSAGTAEKITRDIGAFVVPFVGWSKAVGATKAATLLGRASRSVMAGSLVNFTTSHPVENNLATMLKTSFGFDNAALNSVAASDDDDQLTARVKSVVSNLPLDVAGEAVMEGATHAARMYRAVRNGSQEAKDAVKAVQDDLVVKRTVDKTRTEMAGKTGVRVNGVDPLAPKGPTPKAANDVVTPEGVLSPAKPKPEASKAPEEVPGGAAPAAPAAPTDPKMVTVPADQVKPKRIETMDDFTQFISQTLKAVPADQPERLDKLAKAIMENPHNALDELGIDPLKLNYELFEDPAKIEAMQNSLASVVDEIAQKTGRTGIRVSNAETVQTGRMLGVAPENLQKVVQQTKGLAGRLTGARVLVGQHAHKLVADVDAAIAELASGKGAGKAYNEFVHTLTRHATLLGTLRGAGSEIGRALQSLQITMEIKGAGKTLQEQAEAALEKARAAAAKDAQRAAAKTAKVDEKAAAKEAKAAARTVDPTSPEATKFLSELANERMDEASLQALVDKHGISAERVTKQLGVDWKSVKKLNDANARYDDLFKDVSTDAGKLRLLNQLKNAKGDLEQLRRITLTRNLGFLKRADAIVGETRGNLFSLGTAAMNVMGAGAIMGIKSMSHTLATIGHAAASPFSARQAELAGQHALQLWASVHAPVSAFGDAMANTWAVLKHDSLQEASVLADTAGWKTAATKAQAAAIRAQSGIERGLIREEVDRGAAWMVHPETLQAMSDQIEKFPIGKFGHMGLQWMMRAGATGVNLGGSLTRMSTSALINAPDQFAGTLAARAGAHSAAISQAAEEAAEAGLKGTDLFSYVKQRAFDLADGIDGISDEPFEDGMREVLSKEGHDYAKTTLFQDEFDTEGMKRFSGVMSSIPFMSLFTPFVRTPLRILEQTALDYTPFGLLKKSVRDAWLEADPVKQGEIAARMTMSMSMFFGAYMLADSRNIVGFDGGNRSSARLDRASYSLRVGGDVWEYNRLDPFGTVLGLAADLRQALTAVEDSSDDDLVSGAGHLLEASLWSVFHNVLNKTWMTGFKQINDVVSDPTVEGGMRKMAGMFSSLATRAVPASGIQRQFDKWDTGYVREAQGFAEGLLKSSWGASTLPVKRDTLLGRPVDMTTGERMIGVKAGPETVDPLERELDTLSFDIPAPKTKLKGVSLNSTQISRWLELRGQVTKDSTGMTLDEKLNDLIKQPGYLALGHNGRVDAVKSAMSGYNQLATNQLLREDKKFAYAVLRAETWDEYKSQDKSRAEADAATLKLAQELGITPSE